MNLRFWPALALAGVLLLIGVPATAQGNIQVVNQSIESAFRDHITAYISAESGSEITQVEFFYRVQGQAATSRNVAEFESGPSVEAEFSINQRSVYFPPGTRVEYWWKLTDAGNNTLKTERATYLYLDNRHQFKTLNNNRVTVYWYRGADDFGQALFDQANQGLDQLEQNVGVAIEQPIQIFIYGSQSDLLDAIAVGAQEWTGGQAFADQGVVVMGVSPGNLSWGLKATTHELTHLVIHQATDNPYSDLPRWLDEGLAVYNEDPNRLDAQFRSSFDDAVESNALMTLQTLSSTFPADSDAANLAYGESGAIVKFIIDTYGTEAMAHLLQIFSEGALYDDALEEALGVDMRELDNVWRDSLGLEPLPGSEPAAPIAQPQESQDVSTPPPKTEPAAATRPPTQPTPPQPKASSDGGGRALPCAAGLLPLAVVGAIVQFGFGRGQQRNGQAGRLPACGPNADAR
ncbi:MAG: peptidase MA family metallohydrolase [Anaerolineae bacterium]